jgi:hypothetical protein
MSESVEAGELYTSINPAAVLCDVILLLIFKMSSFIFGFSICYLKFTEALLVWQYMVQAISWTLHQFECHFTVNNEQKWNGIVILDASPSTGAVWHSHFGWSQHSSCNHFHVVYIIYFVGVI